MAINVQRNLADLKKQCNDLGIEVIQSGKRESKTDYILALRDHFINEIYPDGIPMSLSLMLEMESPMLCSRFTEFTPEQKEEIWNSPNWIIEQKEDGCFAYDTPVKLADGSTLPIGLIVEEKLPVEVLSYNENTGKIEPRKVVNWFDNGIKSNFVSLKTSRESSIKVTSNHRFYSNGEYHEIGKDSKVTRLVDTDEELESFVIGTLLGDSTLLVDSVYPRLAIMQSSVQNELFMRKLDILEEFGVSTGAILTYTSGFGGTINRTHTKVDRRLMPIYNLMYRKREGVITQKCITEELLDKLTPLGLAYWYMDDGYRKPCKEDNPNLSNQLSIAGFSTHGFAEDDVKLIANWFSKHGYSAKAHEDSRGKGWYVTLSAEDSQKFFDLVKGYIVPSMQYKLPKSFRGYVSELEFKPKQVLVEYNAIVGKILSSSYQAYDIEVEGNHNYFVDDYLVHNCRLVNYFINHSWDCYSRNISVKDFLPVNYSPKMCRDGIDLSKLKDSFVVDSEIVSSNPNVCTIMGNKGVVCETQLQAVTALLAMNEEDSIRIQREEDCPLELRVFDVLWWNGEWIKSKPLIERIPYVIEAVKQLQEAGVKCRRPYSSYSNKRQFYKTMLAIGAEGGVLKNLLSPYIDSSSRRKDGFVKVKRTMSEAMQDSGIGDGIDAFVSGFEPADDSKGWSGLVGALEFSVYLRDANGNMKPHKIARITNITMDLREKLTEHDAEGNPILKQSWYGKVAEIDAQCISARALRGKHARLVQWRPDRDESTCIMDEDYVKSMVL